MFGETALGQPAYMRLRTASPNLNVSRPIFRPHDNRPMHGWCVWVNYFELDIPWFFVSPRENQWRDGSFELAETDFCGLILRSPSSPLELGLHAHPSSTTSTKTPPSPLAPLPLSPPLVPLRPPLTQPRPLPLALMPSSPLRPSAPRAPHAPSPLSARSLRTSTRRAPTSSPQARTRT